jgi:hypothetical protein
VFPSKVFYHAFATYGRNKSQTPLGPRMIDYLTIRCHKKASEIYSIFERFPTISGRYRLNNQPRSRTS